MSTAAKAKPHNLAEYAAEVFEQDPKTALDLVLAENERIRMEAKTDSEVTFGPNGIEATTLAGLWRLAKIYSASGLVPDHFKQKPENCFIGIQMASRCKVDPFMFLQNCYIVHGRPGIEAKLAIAMANASGVFKTRISFRLEGEGNDRKCTAYTTTADSNELVEEIVTVQQAKDMGWWLKKDSLWPKMTDLMLRYRAAMWLIRTRAPEVLMGMQSKEEIEDVYGTEFIKPSRNTNGKASRINLDELLGEPSGDDDAPAVNSEVQTPVTDAAVDEFDPKEEARVYAKSLGCPEGELETFAQLAEIEPDQRKYLDSKPWEKSKKSQKELI